MSLSVSPICIYIVLSDMVRCMRKPWNNLCENANFGANLFRHTWEKLALEKGENRQEKRAMSGISRSAVLNFQVDLLW